MDDGGGVGVAAAGGSEKSRGIPLPPKVPAQLWTRNKSKEGGGGGRHRCLLFMNLYKTVFCILTLSSLWRYIPRKYVAP